MATRCERPKRVTARCSTDVVAVLPKASDAAQGQQEAAEVMQAIMRVGVPASNIHLGLRADPTLSGRQVRVYVR